MNRSRAWGAVVTLGAFAVCCAAARADPVRGIALDVPSHLHIARLAGAANVPYDGGIVLHHNRTHVIFWQPSGSGMSFDPGYEALIETFLQNVAAASHSPDNVYGLTGQYTDQSGPAVYASSYGGAVQDTDRLPANGCVEPPLTGPGWTTCLNDGQLQAEIERVVRADALPTTSSDVYFLVTPDGFGSCTDSSSDSCALGGGINGYCGYHSQTSSGQILYAVIPYNAVSGHCQSSNPRPNSSTADPTLSTISHEHIEMITDPEGDAWIDSSGNEIADLCLTKFGRAIGGSGKAAWNEDIAGGHYWLQEEWSNEDGRCEPRDETDTVSFGAVLQRGLRRTVRFTARGGDPDGAIVFYSWSFDDGTGGHGQSVRHTFRRPGSYRVVLKTTDSVGNWASYTRTVRVSETGNARRRSPARAKSG